MLDAAPPSKTTFNDMEYNTNIAVMSMIIFMPSMNGDWAIFLINILEYYILNKIIFCQSSSFE